MEATETPTVQTFRALDYRMAEVRDQVEKANRKLARNGLGQFQINVLSTDSATRQDRFGFTERRSFVTYELVRPEMNKIAGWTFVARMDALGDGHFVTAVVPGQELNGFRPEEQLCEHCRINRWRKATYLLRGEDGEIKQVGSTCLAAFLGVEVKGLWALDWEPELKEGDDELGGGTGGWVRTDTPLDVVRAALAVSQNGRGYVTRAAAEWGKATTADLARELLHPLPAMVRNPEPWFVGAEKALKTDENAALGAEVLQFAKDIEGGTDYATNLRALAVQDRIEGRHIGMVASAVAAWYRAKHEQVEQKAAKPVELNEWVGVEGGKVAGVEVTITGIRELDGQWDTTTLFTFKDDQGRIYKWFATGTWTDFEEGDEVTIVRATIKKHSDYNGRKETVLTRAKMENR